MGIRDRWGAGLYHFAVFLGEGVLQLFYCEKQIELPNLLQPVVQCTMTMFFDRVTPKLPDKYSNTSLRQCLPSHTP
jgi:hypothetical protein